MSKSMTPVLQRVIAHLTSPVDAPEVAMVKRDAFPEFDPYDVPFGDQEGAIFEAPLTDTCRWFLMALAPMGVATVALWWQVAGPVASAIWEVVVMTIPY